MACRHLSETFKNGVLDKLEFILTDCDGVLWNGDTAIPGSPETLNALRQKGKKVFYITNNSTKTREEYVKKCKRLGFIAKKDEMFPTSYCVALYLKSINFNKKAYIFGSCGLVEEMNAVGIQSLPIGPDPISSNWIEWVANLKLEKNVGAVVIGFDEHVSYPKLVKAASYLKDPDCLFIASNTDEQFPTDGGMILPGTGTFVAAIVAVTGRKPIVLGKPHKFMLETMKHQHPDLDLSKSLMIGDRLNTDIKLGRINGMQTLLVLTGVSDLKEVEQRKSSKSPDDNSMIPDYYLESLGTLGKLMGVYK